jgi:DNA-binding winged helix-turn-helix (wHTH) protein
MSREEKLDILRRVDKVARAADKRVHEVSASLSGVYELILENGRKKIIAKEELFEKIWEENNLSPSTQRLWQVLHNLNKKLCQLGLPEDFIKNIKGRGYIINYPVVIPVYYRMSELPAHSVKKEEKDRYLSE